jgi:hypothetical protein
MKAARRAISAQCTSLCRDDRAQPRPRGRSPYRNLRDAPAPVAEPTAQVEELGDERLSRAQRCRLAQQQRKAGKRHAA